MAALRRNYNRELSVCYRKAFEGLWHCHESQHRAIPITEKDISHFISLRDRGRGKNCYVASLKSILVHIASYSVADKSEHTGEVADAIVHYHAPTVDIVDSSAVGALCDFWKSLQFHAMESSILAYAAAVAHAYSCHNSFLWESA